MPFVKLIKKGIQIKIYIRIEKRYIDTERAYFAFCLSSNAAKCGENTQGSNLRTQKKKEKNGVTDRSGKKTKIQSITE